MPNLTVKQIAAVCQGLMEAAGAPRSSAEIVGKYLSTANLYGHDSHGIQNVIAYITLIRQGLIDPKAKWRLVKENLTTALIDAGSGIGQVACTEAMKIAIQKGQKYGVGSVGIFNCNHIGRLGDYSMMAAEKGMIGIVYATSDPSVAPWGGMTSMLGTNPISFAMPAGDEKPVMVDFASAAVAEGKV